MCKFLNRIWQKQGETDHHGLDVYAVLSNTKLDEYGEMEEKGGNQAILFKFQSEQPETLFFTYMGDQRENNVDFWEGDKPRFNLVYDFESAP